MADLAITNSFSAGTAIVASQMNTNFTDVTTWANGAPNIGVSGSTATMDGALTVTEALTASSTSQFDGTVTVGANTDGYDVKFFANTTGKYLLWDESEDALTLVGADLIVDTDCLFVDSSNNAVGINTTSPVGSGFTIGRVPSDANEGGQLNLEGGTSYSNPLFLDRYGNDLRLVYNGSVVGSWTSVGSIDIEDAGKLLLGTGDDLQIYADGTNSFIDHNGDGDLWIRANATGEDIYLNAAGNISFQLLGNTKMHFYNNDTDVANIGINTTRSTEDTGQYGIVLFPKGEIMYSNTNAQDQIFLTSNGSVKATGGWAFINDGPAGMLGVDDGNLFFYAESSGTAGNAITWTNTFQVTNAGVLTCASTKSFDIPHPIKGGNHRLRHYDTEGPRPDLIYRGTATLSGGTATVDLDTESDMTDGTWEALCTNPWALVASSGNAVEWSLSGKTLTITSDTADAVCSWMVIGERNDANVGTITTEYENDNPDPFPETEVVEESQPANLTEPPPEPEDDADEAA